QSALRRRLEKVTRPKCRAFNCRFPGTRRARWIWLFTSHTGLRCDRRANSIKKNARWECRAFSLEINVFEGLLDLAFAEFDVLARDRIVLLQHELVGLGAGVLLGDVEEAGVRRRVQADLDGGGLRHGAVLGRAGRARRRQVFERGAENTNP